MKKMNKKGFTLMEMLIVIAIIAILIAIAIPTFTAALEKSRQKTDLANARALKSLVVATFMDDEQVASLGTLADDDTGTPLYLNKAGDTILTSSSNAMTISAKWTGTTYEKNGSTPRYVTVYLNASGKTCSSIPELKDNLPS